MNPLRHRILGLLLLLIGGVLTLACILAPLQDVEDKKPSFSVHMKFVVVCPILVGYGLVLLLLGDRTAEYLGTYEQPSQTAFILGVVLLAMGFLIYYCLKMKLESAGYSF